MQEEEDKRFAQEQAALQAAEDARRAEEERAAEAHKREREREAARATQTQPTTRGGTRGRGSTRGATRGECFHHCPGVVHPSKSQVLVYPRLPLERRDHRRPVGYVNLLQVLVDSIHMLKGQAMDLRHVNLLNRCIGIRRSAVYNKFGDDALDRL